MERKLDKKPKVEVQTPPTPPAPIAPEFKDIQIKCADCPNTFIFTAGEQKYYKDRNLASPKRCHKCRVVRRQRTTGEVRVTQEKD